MLTSVLSCFVLILLAEFGDKSQLVCMLLAGRHRAMPVFLGACAAFALLNILAVSLGSAIAHIVPRASLTLFVSLMFFVFALKALFGRVDEAEGIEEKSGRNIFLTALLMILIAELGDKTQLTVAALSATSEPLAAYIGATSALIMTTFLGVMSGRWLLKCVSVRILHRAGGVLFLVFALWIPYVSFR